MWNLILFTLLIFIPGQATIDVYADSVIGTVGPYLFSSGDEMNEDFSQEGVDSLISFIDVPLLRMGGIAAEYLDWEGNDYNGLWYIDFLDTFLIVDTLSFNTDSLLQFCERTGTEPILTVNFQINDPNKAARLVEYCNGDTLTPMGALRVSKGHKEPYNVTYWCIGNEPDISGNVMPTPWGDWTFYRHFGIPFENWSWHDSSFATREGFSALIDVYIDSMRAHSPIPLEIGGLSLAGNLAWLETVIGENNDKIDWMDIHYYPNYSETADSNLYREWLASPDTGSIFFPPVEVWYQLVCDSVIKYSGGNDIPVNIFEFNAGIIFAEDPLWWNYLDGLFIADALGHFAKVGVPRTGVYSIFEGQPGSGDYPLFGIIRGDTLSMRVGSWVLKLYIDFFGDTLIKTTSDVFGLNAYGSIRDDGKLGIIVVNKDLDSSYTSSINLFGFISNDTMEVWDITHDTTLAAPWNGTKGIMYRGKYTGDSTSFTYTFPKASVTMLWIRPKTGGIQENARCKMQNVRWEICPNPFSQKTIIQLTVNSSQTTDKNCQQSTVNCQLPTANCQLRIFDVSGRLVKSFSFFTPHSSFIKGVSWDGKNNSGKSVGSGIYFCKLQIGDFKTMRKLILLR